MLHDVVILNHPFQQMTSSQLSVSVVLPVHNGERFLAEAIENVLSQQYEPLEIIVVDDGSTDSTAAIANHFENSVRYIRQQQQGPSKARNQGIESSTGEVIAFLDVDDLWPPQKLAQQVGYLAQHPTVEIVQGYIQRMQMEPPAAAQDGFCVSSSTDNLQQEVRGGALKFYPVSEPYPFINLGSAVYRRSVFDKVGLFDETLWDNEDTDWFTRAWENNVKKVVLSDIALFYRMHDRNMTLSQRNLIHHGLIKIYKRHIDRLRANPSLIEQQKKQSQSWMNYLGDGQAADRSNPTRNEDAASVTTP